MKRKIMRSLTLLLALCLLVSAFAACASEDEPGNSSKTFESTPAQSEEGLETDEEGFVVNSINITLDREVKILYSDYLKGSEAVQEEAIGESVVRKAVYDRWQNVQDKLNVEITWVPEPGKWDGSQNTFMQKVQTMSDTGAAYDSIVCYNLLPGAMAHKGLLQNLTDSDYIDLSMPWWPQAYIEEAIVNDTLYGVAENSSQSNLVQLHGVFFNNTLVDSYGLTSPYEYVYNNTWTFDNMLALIKDIGSDVNQNGKKDDADFYGLVTGTQAKIETWFFAMGYRYSQKNANGEIELLLSDSNKMVEWVDRFTNATSGKDFLIHDTTHTKAFFENRSVLYMTSLVMIEEMIAKNVKMDYGVVPVPKGSDSQERYLSNVANHYAVWCIPNATKDFQESTALIECMAYESYRTVAPIYFDICVKLRYAPDERLYDMYDKIRDSITFDFCQTYSFVFAKDPRTLITNCALGKSNWASQWGNEGTAFEKSFAEILTLYGQG